MAIQDKRLARIARLSTQIETGKRLVAQQMKRIESGLADDSDGWVVLVNLEEDLENHERMLTELMKGNAQL